jgi:hypothetical protein
MGSTHGDDAPAGFKRLSTIFEPVSVTVWVRSHDGSHWEIVNAGDYDGTHRVVW